MARLHRQSVAAAHDHSQWRIRELVRVAKLARPPMVLKALANEARFTGASDAELGEAVRLIAAGRAGR
ncbi:hypothetical protein LUX29_18175 [Aureimonas altamirensis]|uniref:hypothetical protein n=1 Tax=Aureimonas altamirensis TaxID=370622 RepID=UPI001E36ED1C|nr:hypothetical protein [Aureimonas altamirensis]UHD44931.1 hypothetical protein LUX29_18175 [Aureimonas altamirensis]